MEVSRIAVARLSQGLGVANMEFGLKQMQWCRADTWHNMAQLLFGWGDLPLEPFTFLISLARAQSSACNVPGKGMKREHMNTYGAFCRTRVPRREHRCSQCAWQPWWARSFSVAITIKTL